MPESTVHYMCLASIDCRCGCNPFCKHEGCDRVGHYHGEGSRPLCDEHYGDFLNRRPRLELADGPCGEDGCGEYAYCSLDGKRVCDLHYWRRMVG